MHCIIIIAFPQKSGTEFDSTTANDAEITVNQFTKQSGGDSDNWNSLIDCIVYCLFPPLWCSGNKCDNVCIVCTNRCDNACLVCTNRCDTICTACTNGHGVCQCCIPDSVQED